MEGSIVGEGMRMALLVVIGTEHVRETQEQYGAQETNLFRGHNFAAPWPNT